MPIPRAYCLVSLIFLALLPPSTAFSIDVVVDGLRGESLDQTCLTSAGLSGAVLVSRGERTLLQKGYGYADESERRANTPEALFDIASLSKQFTAAAILALEEEGKLSTNDRLKDHIISVPESYRDVTIHQLLTHTAGLPAGGSGCGLVLETAAANYLSAEPIASPGEEYAYSNVGYALLAGVIETVSGEPFEQYLRQRLFQRAGLAATCFCGESKPTAMLALGYSKRGGPPRSPLIDPYPPEDEFGYEYRGMGGVVTNISDLERWVRALQTNKVLTAKSRHKLFTPATKDYSYGWEVFRFPNGQRCIGHGGSVRGFTSKLWWFPDDGGLIIVLANSDKFDYGLLQGLRAALFRIDEEGEQPIAGGGSLKPVIDTKLMAKLVGEHECLYPQGVTLTATAEKYGVRFNLMVKGQSKVQSKMPTNSPELEKSTDIIESLAAGDGAPLAAAMNSSIPASWPELMTKSIWPRHEDQWGVLESIRPLGTGPVPNKPATWRAVWLVLSHERGERLAMVGFRPSGRLQLMMLDVAEKLNLNSTLYSPISRNQFESLAVAGRDQTQVTLGEDGTIRVGNVRFGIDFSW